MTLSRMLAMQPDPFRTSDFTGSPISKMDLKLLVMNAQKFIVDSTFRTLFTDIEKEKLDPDTVMQMASKKQAHYSEFARSPYQTIAVESQGEIIVIRQGKGRDLVVYVIDAVPVDGADVLDDIRGALEGAVDSKLIKSPIDYSDYTKLLQNVAPINPDITLRLADQSTAASSLIDSKEPLKDAEYFTRRAEYLGKLGSKGFLFAGIVIVLEYNEEKKTFEPVISVPNDVTSSALKTSQHYDQLLVEAGLLCFNILEFLLRLNASNAKTKVYKPTPKELEVVPANMRKSYLYHILDLHFSKEKMEFNSLADIAQYQDRKLTTKSREHLVRGHFKRVKGKLLWWNSFVRCRNSESGIVDKDYRVN